MASCSFALWGNSDPSGLCCALPFMAVWATLMISWFRHYHLRIPALLETWAAENGLQMLSKERRNFFRGPFYWNSSGHQVVYRVQVENRKGRRMVGWVRLGSYWWPYGDQIDVRWDPPPPDPIPDDQLPTRGNPLMWDQDLDT
jgi:hypothetical protein